MSRFFFDQNLYLSFLPPVERDIDVGNRDVLFHFFRCPFPSFLWPINRTPVVFLFTVFLSDPSAFFFSYIVDFATLDLYVSASGSPHF